ncbi:MAG: PhzF family phenazine biosynthesis protein [Gemmatimonadota bacterium]|jgi:PhzF family phenazine biosynthesis protein|nr:PhzF family phenazine biosynthesis protein [Gemmatimonadota bacterium]
MRTVPIVQVDTFTRRPFAGNPAAVCILDELPPEWWLCDVAREINLSRTACLIPHEDGFDLRWFAPDREVDLCGHATLASAHVLWEEGHLRADQPARFHTRGGELIAHLRAGWIEIDFPARPVSLQPAPCGLAEALGVEILWVGSDGTDLLVELADEKTVRTLCPDLAAIARIPVRGVVVTSRAITSGVDFVSRFFAPRQGVPEDPVTSSAHCALAPFWSERLGAQCLTGYQVSARGGTVRVTMNGSRVLIAGQAVTVLRGSILGHE